MSDARTLRLANPEISIEELDVFLVAVTPKGLIDRQVVESKGMKLEKAHRIQVAVNAFLRPKRAHQRLSARLEQARQAVEAAIAAKKAPPLKESELAESIPQRLRELSADRSMAELYSAGTLSALEARVERLLALPRP